MATPSAITRDPKGAFLRVLGVGFGIAVSLGNCIGSGIMRTPGEIAARLPSIPLIMCAWIVGALYSLVGAWSLSEVGAMFPRAGAYYTVARRAFGDYVSFVVGWTDCVSLCGAMATITILAGEYFGDLVPRLANHNVSIAMGLMLLLVLIQSPASHQ
jgi:basic amino acid/polyamine antiporter, APA family